MQQAVAENLKNPILEAQDLSVSYQLRKGTEILALDGVNLEIEKGEFIAIVGPSGCGKSTLLKTFSGLLKPVKGCVRIDGDLIVGPHDGVGFAFQSPALLPWRNVLDNVLFPIEMKGLGKEDYVKKAFELIELAGLKGFETKYPSELSGGMKQRAAVIEALVHDPKILFLDEPFGSLDALTREELNIALQNIWMTEKTTTILVTHEISEAVFLADKVYVMSSRPGRVIHVEEIRLPRPRSYDDALKPPFAAHTNAIRKLIQRRVG